MTMITNDKEAFEYIKEQLLKQNEKSLDYQEDCQYRGHSSYLIEKAKELSGYEYEYIDDNSFDLFINELHKLKPDLKCAAGHVIHDVFYDSDFEGKSMQGNNEIEKAIAKSNPVWKLTDNSYKMLHKLQQIHDSVMVWDWEVELSKLNINFDKYGDYEEDNENG